MADYDMSIHRNPDARAWAKFFMETYRENPDIVNESTMTSWFANAMMAMHDHLCPNLAPAVLPDGSAVVVGSVECQN